MTTDPSANGVFIGTFGNTTVPAPVPEGSWRYLCTRVIAQFILTQFVKNMTFPMATLYDAGPSEHPAMPLMYTGPNPDQTIKFWGIRGTDAVGNAFDESAADLFDRLTKPGMTDNENANATHILVSKPLGAALPGWSEIVWG